MEFKERIEEQIIGIGKGDIPMHEKQVLRILYVHWRAGDQKVKQQDLAMALFLSEEEGFRRQVRQIIRNLRTLRWAPILSDHTGYWLPQTDDETRTYLRRLEHELKSRVYASFETYKAMSESLGINSEYFDEQERLLKQKAKTEVPSASQPGKKYEIFRVDGIGFICTCPGYNYRKTCRHAEEAAKKHEG